MARADIVKQLSERLGLPEGKVEEVLRALFETAVPEVPPYFDRYVASEIRRLEDRIAELREFTEAEVRSLDGKIMELREFVEREIARLDGKIVELREFAEWEIARLDGKIVELREFVEREIARLDRKISEETARLDRRFDKLERWFLWLLGFVATSLLGIIAALVMLALK